MKSFIKILCILLLFSVMSSCQKRRALVVGKIQKASKLSTTEFKVDKLVFGVKNKRILWVVKLNQAEFLAKSQATIKTGVDLEKIKENDISIKGSKINLVLPPVEVINFSYPAEQFKHIEIMSKNAFSSKITLEDQEKFFREAELDIRNSLKYMGIVEATQKKTRKMLEVMLHNLGYDEIYIEFKDGDLITEILEENQG